MKYIFEYIYPVCNDQIADNDVCIIFNTDNVFALGKFQMSSEMLVWEINILGDEGKSKINKCDCSVSSLCVT